MLFDSWLQFFEIEVTRTGEEALEEGEGKEQNHKQGDKGNLNQEQSDTFEHDDKQTSFTHQALPLSPSWTNFEDCKFDNTDFSSGIPSSLSPIAEEEATLISDKQHSDPFTSKDTATNNSIGEQAVSEEEDKGISEEENPFRKDSFIGLENVQCDKVEKFSFNNSQPFNSNTASGDKTFESCDHNSADTKVDQEENPFRKDSFVLFQEEQLASAKELQNNIDRKAEASLNTVVEEPLFHDPFLQSDPFTTKPVTELSPDKDTLDSLPEEEPRSKFQLIAPHSELGNLELADSDQLAPFEYNPFEEEPFFSEQPAIISHLTSNSLAAAVSDSYFGFDNSDIPPPLLESSIVDSSTQWHFDSFDHSFDPHFDTLDHNSVPNNSLFSAVDKKERCVDQPVDKVESELPVDHPIDSEPSIDPPVDLEPTLDPPFDFSDSVEEPDLSLDKMAVDANAIPDIQDLDNTFSLDDLTSVIAEMELVTESLNEEPTPPPVAEKPKKVSPPSVAEKPKKASPPVPAKKYEKKPASKSNEQSSKKPQLFLNEVNLEKSKEKAQQIDIDIAGDVFSELEEQLQQELLARSDQVPDEVKEVLKELNAPYTMGLENIEAELGVKSGDSEGDVGDLISELHGMGDFENLGEVIEEEEEEFKQNGDEQSSELAESGLTDAYAESSMDDLLSELKGMDDGNNAIPPPTLPKPKKEEMTAEEDPL